MERSAAPQLATATRRSWPPRLCAASSPRRARSQSAATPPFFDRPLWQLAHVVAEDLKRSWFAVGHAVMHCRTVAAALCVFLRCVPGVALQQPSWFRPTGSTLHFQSGSSSATVRIPGFAQTILLPVQSAGATAPRARNALTRHARARNALTWSELNTEARNNELVRLSTASRILRC
jgi:hypothetical protein